ncbi:CehA/McbA family metallohydrolase domain-containing protein [Aeoliella mucimassa]|uniref:Uncharacterized protein n=1 Tax=Aeoliella mucimassa TaxID=2527972 RepID=A0A518ASX9_9BACT|nr:hypothetical protein [Aeoliella mucimassa]QDU57812.1 hypothetical protein Pan181_40350 [Aeoliella mucimassa]
MSNILRISLFILFAGSPTMLGYAATPDGQLQINIIDPATQTPLPVRIELTNTRGRTVRLGKSAAGALGNHFYLTGQGVLGLKRGDYLFTLDAGPEYKTQRGDFKIERHADDSKVVEMHRFTDLEKEGWYAGDFDSVRNAKDLPLMAQVEALHFVPSVAWTYDGKKWSESPRNIMLPVDEVDPQAAGRKLGAYAARVEQPGGTLLLFADEPMVEKPFEVEAGWSTEKILLAAVEADLHVVAASPVEWELPVWIATDELSTVALLTRNDYGDYRQGSDKGTRPRDTSFYPGKQGQAQWEQAVYFHLLNCGLQVTPVAGSGSGANEMPLGSNRTYVYHANAFSPEAWWRGVEQGATVVTNGPLLRPQVGGQPPGTTFSLGNGGQVDYQVGLNLASRDARVEYLEVIKNGETFAEVRLSDWVAKKGQLPPVSFDSSGWFAVRAATTEEQKYQYALNSPYYVESTEGPRVSRESVEFFLAWLDELAELPADERSASEAEIAKAREFWQQLLSEANAP